MTATHDVVSGIVAVVAGHVFNHTTEDGLQAGLAEQLADAGLPAVREVRLTLTERIDLMVGSVGVEVKVGGSPAVVPLQLTRYAATGQVTALVLVTTRHLHLTLDGKVLHGVPVRLYPNAHGWIAADVGRIDLAAAGGDWAAEPVPPAGLGIQTLLRAAVVHESSAYRESLEQLGLTAQQTDTNLQQARDRWDRHGQAQAVIEARRNRYTGPTDPRGIDGRARRHQHPRRSAARNASPATHGTATPATRGWLALIGEPEPWPAPVITRLADGALALGFDPAWQ